MPKPPKIDPKSLENRNKSHLKTKIRVNMRVRNFFPTPQRSLSSPQCSPPRKPSPRGLQKGIHLLKYLISTPPSIHHLSSIINQACPTVHENWKHFWRKLFKCVINKRSQDTSWHWQTFAELFKTRCKLWKAECRWQNKSRNNRLDCQKIGYRESSKI